MSIEEFFNKVVSPSERKEFFKDWKTAFFGLIIDSKEALFDLAFDVFIDENKNLLFCTLYLDEEEKKHLVNSLSDNQIEVIKSYWDKEMPIVIYKDKKYLSSVENCENPSLHPILLQDFNSYGEVK